MSAFNGDQRMRKSRRISQHPPSTEMPLRVQNGGTPKSQAAMDFSDV